MSLNYYNSQLRRLYYAMPVFVREGMAAVYSMMVHRRRFGGVFRNHIAELKDNADQTAEEQVAGQLRRLRLTLNYAGTHCPYYREVFHKLDFEPNTIGSLSDLRRLPLLDKETVRTQAERLLAQPLPNKTVIGETSGTTGTALKFVVTEEANQRHHATQWFHMSWAGIEWGDRWALFGGQPVAQPDSMRPPFWVLDRFVNELIFSTRHINAATLPAYARVLADFQPAVICGYPSAIHLIAEYLLDVKGYDIRPKGVFTWAETTLGYQRDVIEQAFGCRVYSSYGNGERTGHLLQCELGNFHVVPETCIVEVLNSSGSPAAPGELGEMVCTSLVERAMPLIRYRIGDRAIAAKEMCSCGRTTPIIGDIAGRTNNFVLGRDGRRFGPLCYLFNSSMKIKEAQFVQIEPGSVCIRVVPRKDFGPSEQASLMEAAHQNFGNQVDVVVQVVDAIKRTSEGKFKYVISHLE